MADHPLTLAYLGGPPPGTGTILERVQKQHAGPMIVDRAARDLARYEHELARLATCGPVHAPTEPLPSDETKLKLASSMTLLMYGADLPGMIAALRAGTPATPRPKRGWYLMVAKGGGKVDVTELDRDGGWLFEWFRDPTPLKDALEMMDEREPFERLWAQGLLVRA